MEHAHFWSRRPDSLPIRRLLFSSESGILYPRFELNFYAGVE